MKDTKKITAIILAAGNSTRYGKNINKNLEKIKDKSILQYSIEAFIENEYVDDIIIAAKEAEIEKIDKVINENNYSKPIKIIVGGKNRGESAQNCIKSTTSDIVIIQDGARPAIKQYYINKCIENMKLYKGVTVAVPTKDTIKIADENGIVKHTTERKNTWQIQTPQCFDRNVLLEMYEKYNDDNITDDCSLLEKGNYKIKIIMGDYSNIKITTYEDIIFMGSIIGKMKIINKNY